ncbi:MAG: DUF3048 domain-containing protein [Candidatus Nanopelagicaceae bacterium]
MMRFKVIALVALLSLTACATKNVSAISGKEAVDGPIIVVKIDDTPDAHPQVGIDKADLVYIEQVEGGLVRLAAIFSTEIPAAIGPVRSARISDIDLMAQFGKVAFFYSGAQSKFLPVIKAANIFDIGAEHESPKLYTRDPNRFAPYNMILSGSEVKERISGLEVAKASNIQWSFGKLANDGNAISAVKVKWPASNYSAKWNGKSWDLYQNGEADITSDGVQLSPSTFIIQNVVITDSIYKDKLGGITPLSITVGEGTGWVLRDGVAIKATWNRPDSTSGTTWSDENGKEIKFAAGQIWVALTDQAPEFTAAPTKK